MNEIYVLGTGSIGGLIATQLSMVSKTPITLLLNSEQRLTDFLNRGSAIRYRNLTKARNPIVQDFRFKGLANAPSFYTGKPQPIHNLIVTTKSHQTVGAMERIVPSLSRNSNVVYIQNGFGVIDAVREKLFFNNEENMPNMYQGVISHGVFRKQPFEVTHAGIGDLKLAKVPSPFQTAVDEGPAPMIEDLMASDILNCKYMPYKEFLLFQYEKLVVNACINPLTSVLDSANGELLRLYQTETIFNGIIREAIQVIIATAPESLKNDPTFLRVIDHKRLLAVALSVAKSTRHNSSSMREDIRHMRNTEIDFINGYIFKKAQENHLFTPYNKMMIDLVKAKLQLNVNRNEQAVKMAS